MLYLKRHWLIVSLEGNIVFDIQCKEASLPHSQVKEDLTKMDHFEIWYTNADSLTNKLDELKSRVNEEKVEAIAVTEALPKHSLFTVQEEELAIQGFNSVSNFEMTNGCKGRGIIVYVKEGLNFVKRDP